MLANRRRWLVALALSLVVAAAGGGHGMAQVEEAASAPAAGGPPAAAQPEGGGPAAGAAAAGPAMTNQPLAAGPPAAAAPRVRAVHRLLVEHAGEEETAEAAGGVPARPVGLGAVVAVEIAGLDALIAEAGGIGELVLFLDGIALPGLVPVGVRPERGWLIYRLERTERADAAWHLLLGNASSLVRRLSLSVGVDEAHPIPTDVEDFPLAVIHPWEMAIFAVLLAAALTAFFVAARRTDLLRDRTAHIQGNAVRPYSLARCQMAWWFFLVVAAYVFIWLAIDELDTITPSVLALIGIGAATALGAGMIDTDKQKSGEEAVRALGAANAMVRTVRDAAAGIAARPEVATQSVATDPTAPAAPAAAAMVTPEVARQVVAEQDMASLVAQEVEMSRLQQRADDMKGAVKGGSRGFRHDLLWDGKGMSFHRFQIVVWTLVLGLIFVASVYAELAMPDFSATLLGLMGISSGTYLGFKLPERQQ